MRPPTTRHTSITVKSTGRPLGGPKYGPVAVPRPRTRTQIVSPDSAASSIVNLMSGKARCTSRMASLTWAIASAPRPAVPNWWSRRSGEQSSSATEPSPVAKPSSNIRCITAYAAERVGLAGI